MHFLAVSLEGRIKNSPSIISCIIYIPCTLFQPHIFYQLSDLQAHKDCNSGQTGSHVMRHGRNSRSRKQGISWSWWGRLEAKIRCTVLLWLLVAIFPSGYPPFIRPLSVCNLTVTKYMPMKHSTCRCPVTLGHNTQ